MSVTERPRVFLSYSWTSPEYIERVVELAQQLVSDDIDVVFDQWDLKEGQDVHAFMEQAVNDPSISKVLVLIDPLYAAKANGREGGVGKETLIISAEVYDEAAQIKFIPVVMERNEQGAPELPSYMKGRFWVDLSLAERRDENYVRIVRNIYGKPELEKPQFGRRPSYLAEHSIILRTGRTAHVFKDAVRRNQPTRHGLFVEYLERVHDAFASEWIVGPSESVDAHADEVVASIERFLPYRDEFVETLDFSARYLGDGAIGRSLHRFFEQLANQRLSKTGLQYRDEVATENLGFLEWELFVYTTAVLLRAELFSDLGTLLRPYLIKHPHNAAELQNFQVHNPPFIALQDYINKRGPTRYNDYAGSLLQSRAGTNRFTFEALIEADSLLSVRSMLDPELPGWWYPHTVRGFQRRLESVPFWRRTHSDSFLREVLPLFGVSDRERLKEKIASLDDQELYHAGFGHYGRGLIAGLFGLKL